MSDNYNQIPISVNARQQSQLNNLPSVSNYINSDKQLTIHSSPKNYISSNGVGNNPGTAINDLNQKISIYSNNKYILSNSNAVNNNNSAINSNYPNSSFPVKNPPITKIITRSNDLDYEYLDLNELNNVINNDENENYDETNGAESNLNTPKTKRSVLVDQISEGNNLKQLNQYNHHHHHHKYSRYESLLLKELTQLGIKKEKLEKSLAATGYQNSVDAINWLMKHAKDPLLANESIASSRDYMLVLCPIGRLASQISTFFQQSKIKCGPNEAHYHHVLPYMKLSPFFKVIYNKPLRLKNKF